MTDGPGSTESACTYVGIPRIKSSAKLTRCTEERAAVLFVPENNNEYT